MYILLVPIKFYSYLQGKGIVIKSADARVIARRDVIYFNNNIHKTHVYYCYYRYT